MDAQVCRALKRITLGSKFGVAFDPILNHEMPSSCPTPQSAVQRVLHLSLPGRSREEREYIATHLPFWSLRAQPTVGGTPQTGNEDQVAGTASGDPGFAPGASRRGRHQRGIAEEALSGGHLCGFRAGAEQCHETAASGAG